MVTLIKRCRRHGIVLEPDSELGRAFAAAFPEARYDGEAGEWVISWEKGFFAQSNQRLVDFFKDRGVEVAHDDQC